MRNPYALRAAVLVICAVFAAGTAQAAPDSYAPLGPGRIQLDAVQVSPGVAAFRITTDLPDVVSLYVKTPEGLSDLVRVVTAEYAESFARRLPAEAVITVDQPVLNGVFEQKVEFDLSDVRLLHLVAVQSDGVEYPIHVTALKSLDGGSVTLTFPGDEEFGGWCYTVSMNCSGSCGRKSKTCCNIPPQPCADCVNCVLSCFSCPS